MATFGDVQTPQGLQALNAFLAKNSYISEFSPSKADLSVFEALTKPPTAEYPHIQRWYKHIASFEKSELSSWGGGDSLSSTGNGESKNDNDGGDDIDLFASDDEEDAEAQRIREERVAAYLAKKAKEPAQIAKSSLVLDIKPWDDETEMERVEWLVRSIVMDGLLWGSSQFVPVGYGIHKLQITCVIEDEKVSIEALTEKIAEFQYFIQSVDIAAFNKI